MAYDEQLAQRFRNAIEETSNISEKRMMGGLCFLHHGNMIGGADRTKEGVGRFMLRVGKDNEVEALARPGARIVEMGSRRMSGMVFVDEGACNDQQLGEWVTLALAFVSTLPAK